MTTDKERLDWLAAHDHWITENGLAVWTARIETRIPEDDMSMVGWDLRGVIDAAMNPPAAPSPETTGSQK